MTMHITIRPARESDHPATENLTRDTFWNLYAPGCSEHLVLHRLRNGGGYLPALDIVALDGDTLVGHIISSLAFIIDTDGQQHEVLCAGPFSVHPAYQKQGIGSQLMVHTIEEACALAYRAIILFGNPQYYHRFGYRNAQDYSITTKDGLNFDPFMALELHEHGLTDVHGRFIADAAFDVTPADVLEFDAAFPFKEKLVTETQFKH